MYIKAKGLNYGMPLYFSISRSCIICGMTGHVLTPFGWTCTKDIVLLLKFYNNNPAVRLAILGGYHERI